MPERDVIAATERVLLRPWRVDEADRFFDVYRQVEVARWIGGRPMADRTEAVQMIERNLGRFAAGSQFGSWAIIENSTGAPAGSVLLKPLPDGTGEMMGWHLHPDSWGRGLAVEAARALLEYGFALGVEEIWALTHVSNARSARVCERLGMDRLGVTHRWYPEPHLMFWIGAQPDQQPTRQADQPAPS